MQLLQDKSSATSATAPLVAGDDNWGGRSYGAEHEQGAGLSFSGAPASL